MNARRDPDHAIEALAANQHGVVARRQLIAAGIPPDVIDRRLAAKRLHSLHRGIYRVGPLLTARGEEMAAVLVCGDAAVLSHRTAAVLWQLLAALRPGTATDVIISPELRHRRSGVRTHRVALRTEDVTKLDGIPLTTPSRTLYDLAGAIPARDLERALAEALVRGLTSRRRLEALLAREACPRGKSRLVALLAGDAQPALTVSEGEEAYLRLVARARIRRPEVNVVVCGYRVDFFWPKERLVAEIDGYAYHASRDRFENDRRRDADLMAAGIRVLRVTWRQIENEPEALMARLAELLARSD